MDTTVIALGGTLQLIAIAALGVSVLMLGLRILGQGPKGTGALYGEVITLLIAAFVIFRPNDALGLLTKTVGGIQTLSMPH